MTNSFTPIGNQQSHAIFGLSQSNALACLPPDAMISAGDVVQMLLVTSN